MASSRGRAPASLVTVAKLIKSFENRIVPLLLVENGLPPGPAASRTCAIPANGRVNPLCSNPCITDDQTFAPPAIFPTVSFMFPRKLLNPDTKGTSLIWVGTIVRDRGLMSPREYKLARSKSEGRPYIRRSPTCLPAAPYVASYKST